MPDLFAPVTMGRLKLRNRFMRSATAEYFADTSTGAPHPRQKDMYRSLAEGGVALIVAGNVAVDVAGRDHPFACSIADDGKIPLWREVIRPAREAGARMMVQINHGGAMVCFEGRPKSLTPSGVQMKTFMPCEPVAASGKEILGIVEAFGRAAVRAREAGFDGVQVHACHGYLVSQFLMPVTNLRTDRWGGDADRRGAFLKAVLEEIRSRVGEGFAVWVKLGVSGSPRSGMTVADGARAALIAASSGADCIEISTAWGDPESVDGKSEACYLPLAREVRAAVGPDVPLALVNGIRSRRTMEQVLSGGGVQIISLCRPLIAEPDLVRRLETGAADRSSCIGCNRCRSAVLGNGIGCHRETGGGITPMEIFQGKAKGAA